MKFYFCEACGRRVTEKDVEGGQARDKKLKGVYCRECAIGVTTMDTLPLSDEEAKKTLAEEAPQKPRPRRSTGAAAAPRAGGKRSSSRSSQSHLQPPAARRGFPVVMVGSGAGVLALILVIAVAKRNTEAPRKPAAGNQTPRERKVAEPISNPSPRRFTEPAVKKPDQPAPASGEVSITPSQRLERELSKLDPENRAGRIALAETFIKENGDAALSSRQREELERLRAAVASSSPGAERKDPTESDTKTPGVGADTEKTDEKAPAEKKVSPKPERPAQPLPGPRPHEIAFDTHLEALLTALAGWQIADAERVAEKMMADPQVGVWRAAAECVPGAVAVLKKESTARDVALKGLIGKDVRLRTRKRVLKGVVVGVKGEDLQLKSRFFIDGKPKVGKASTVSMSELADGELARLLKIPKPATPVEWAARALRELAAQRIDAADAALKQCTATGFALEPPLRRRWEEQKKGVEEAKAERFWTDFEKHSLKELAREPARLLLKRLVSFRVELGKTAYATQRTGEIEKARRTLERIGYSAEATLTEHVIPPAPLGAIKPTGTGTLEDPYLYQLTSSRGVDLAGFRVHAKDGKSFTLDLGGGDLTGTSSPGLKAELRSKNPGVGGNIVIQNVKTVSMGGIETLIHHSVKVKKWKPLSGDIRIGSRENRAGDVRVAHIHTRHPGRFCGHIGDVAVYGSGDVRIEDEDGKAGDILTWGKDCWGTAGSIRISHKGSFSARILDASGYGRGDYPAANHIILNGNASGKQRPTGDASVSEIRAVCEPPRHGKPGGGIRLTGYRNVTLGKLLTHSPAAKAASVVITDISGEVRITGEINLKGKDGQNGNLSITTTGRGSITLAKLDLTKVGVVTLSAGGGRSHVAGPLLGFKAANPTGQRQLVAPAGQRILYSNKAGGPNEYLGGKTYPLRGGGRLEPETP